MKLTALYTDEDAVTPAVGIVLMVAITVILASIIGVFSFGLGSETTPEGPNVIVAFEYDDSGHSPGDTDSWGTRYDDPSPQPDGLLTFTHDQGSSVPPERLELVVESGTSGGPFTATPVGTQEFYDTGDELSVWVQADDTVRVVWRNPEGSKSTAVAVWDGA